MDLERANAYIEDLYRSEGSLEKDAFIRATEMKDFVPVIDNDVARFIKALLLVMRPQKVLEIGASIGFSTCSIASVIKGWKGRITTIEFDAVVAGQAQKNFARLGLAEVIDLRQGDARVIVPALEPGYDLIFQDVDNRLYAELLPACLRLLKPGGVLLADDALFPVMDLDASDAGLVEPTRQFNRLVVNMPGLTSTILPIGDGILFACKANA